MSWRKAYLKQAESDYAVFILLNTGNRALCHKLHYLQMTTEKLAKSFMSTETSPPPKKTHFALVRFLKMSKSRPEIRRALGFEKNYKAYVSYIDSLLDIAERVEQLAPVGGDYDVINPEYPWRDSLGNVQCPCSYAFPELRQTELAKFRTLVSNLFRVGHSHIGL